MDRYQRKILKSCTCLQFTLSHPVCFRNDYYLHSVTIMLALNNLYETMSQRTE